jgi:DNA repair photolyase
MGIGYYFQYTLNDYEAEGYEPNIPPLHKRIEVFKTLSERIGPEKVIWRFDPLIISDSIPREKLVKKVQGVMNQVVGYTRKMVLSFFKPGAHKAVDRNLSAKRINCKKFTTEDLEFVAYEIGKMCVQNGIEVAACAEGLDLSAYGIGRNKCIDDALIRRVFFQDEPLMAFIGDGQGLKDQGQRPYCECIVSRDIGEYNTCDHSCAYCYANDSEAAVKKNLALIDQSGEMLLQISKEGPDMNIGSADHDLPN